MKMDSEKEHWADSHVRRPMMLYWAVQVGLLTPLTFVQRHLSPLAAFTSDVYFLHNGRQ